MPKHTLTDEELKRLHEKGPLEMGKEALKVLRERSEEPLFVLLTGVFHSAGVPYERHQPWIEKLIAEKEILEKIVTMSHQERIDFFKTPQKPLVERTVVLPSGRSFLLPPAYRCYRKICIPEPPSCSSKSNKEQRERVISCLHEERENEKKNLYSELHTKLYKSIYDKLYNKYRKELSKKISDEKKVDEEARKKADKKAVEKIQEEALRSIGAGGFGKKICDLMREYMGDDDAVAVDTHVARWLEDITGFYQFIDRKTGRYLIKRGSYGAQIHEKGYKEAQEKIRETAKKWGVTPAELQTTAWILGACSNSNYKPIKLSMPKDAPPYEVPCDKIPEELRVPSRREVAIIGRKKKIEELYNKYGVERDVD